LFVVLEIARGKHHRVPGVGQDPPEIAANITAAKDSDFDFGVACGAGRAERGAKAENRAADVEADPGRVRG
jgi:hypothetical protein